MTHVFHRHLRHTPPVAAGSSGMFIRDAEGREYLDASGGAAVSSLGHAHPEVLAAMHAQLDRLAYAHTSFFTSEVAEQLADELVASAPEGMSHVYLVSGGSEAVEAALKMARQYFVETGQPQRTHFIARRQSYHGNTLGALAVGGNAWRREPFAPILVPATHVAPCYPYREQRADESAEQYGLRLAAELEAAILAQGADRVIAFVAETVGGATAGVLTPVPGYFKAVRAVCDKYGVLLILDEVMCGMGRTGTMFACEQEGIVENAAAMGQFFGTELAKLQAEHPSIGEVRGLGCFWGLELVKDRATREPLVPFNGSGEAAKPIAAVMKRALESGLYLMTHWNVVMCCPPLTITRDELDEAIEMLDDALSVADEFCT
jgi:adenosylmethionine-8-amino-7-oxononanoate aminotransferase